MLLNFSRDMGFRMELVSFIHSFIKCGYPKDSGQPSKIKIPASTFARENNKE